MRTSRGRGPTTSSGTVTSRRASRKARTASSAGGLSPAAVATTSTAPRAWSQRDAARAIPGIVSARSARSETETARSNVRIQRVDCERIAVRVGRLRPAGDRRDVDDAVEQRMRALETAEPPWLDVACTAEADPVDGRDVLLARRRDGAVAAVAEHDRGHELVVGDAAVVAVVGHAVGEVLHALPQDVVDAHLELGLAACRSRQDGQRRLARARTAGTARRRPIRRASPARCARARRARRCRRSSGRRGSSPPSGDRRHRVPPDAGQCRRPASSSARRIATTCATVSSRSLKTSGRPGVSAGSRPESSSGLGSGQRSGLGSIAASATSTAQPASHSAGNGCAVRGTCVPVIGRDAGSP